MRTVTVFPPRRTGLSDTSISRHLIVACGLVFALSSLAFAKDGPGMPLDPGVAKYDEATKLDFYDLRLLPVEGRPVGETKAFYDRLPAKAEGKVRDAVWGLSRHSAGLCARFVTEAKSIGVRWTLTSDRLAMTHMPATGVSGIDLYVRGENGSWRWLAIGQPRAQTTVATLAQGLPAGTREYLLYLPLYNGVSSVEVGVEKGARLAAGPKYDAAHEKPLVFYGTSITQGGCASRPGMVHTAILGRRLQRPVVNLGFSGNGRMEKEVLDCLVEIDASVYVIDCLPNMQGAEVAERTEPLVRQIREARPNTPILLVEDRSYTNGHLLNSSKLRNDSSRAAFKQAYDRLQKAGVKGLTYLPGDGLLGDDFEGTVDASHPTDLGFVRQADAFEKALRPLLEPGQ